MGTVKFREVPWTALLLSSIVLNNVPGPAPAEALTHSTYLVITKLDCVMDLIPYKKLPNVHLFHPIILLFQFNDGFIIN